MVVPLTPEQEAVIERSGFLLKQVCEDYRAMPAQVEVKHDQDAQLIIPVLQSIPALVETIQAFARLVAVREAIIAAWESGEMTKERFDAQKG